MQPGRPQGWARLPTADGRTVGVLCLPGNPLSAIVSHELFVRAAVEKMLGSPPRPWEPAVAAVGWHSPAGRRQFLPVVVSVDADGTRVVRPAHRRGSASHLVTAPAHADALADVPADLDRVEAGDLVGIRSLS